ncbi:MAG: queuosine precursor transporter, partial [Gammaproteobacteria bacterium]
MVSNLLAKIKIFFTKDNSIKVIDTYRIVAVDDSYQDTGKVYVKVQVVGSSKIFNKPVSELYSREWLSYFSKEDVAHIAALYTAEHTQNLALIKQFPKSSAATRASIVIVGILFTGFLILSNLTGFKVAEIGGIAFPAGLMFFPLTYVFDDILTEVYGFKVSRRVIWTGLFAALIVILGTWVTIYLPASSFWNEQAAYEVVYNTVPRVFIASIIAYLVGEFTNSVILAKLKILTSGHYLWLRAITSTAVGAAVDTVIFLHIAMLFTVPYEVIWQMIIVVYLFKLIYEICAVPITYKVANYLKRKDNIDYYDFKTKFNPFS